MKKTYFICIFIIAGLFSNIICAQKLPEIIHLKTKTETFTRNFYFALRSNKIWYKKNPYYYTGIDENKWELLHGHGYPVKSNDPNRIIDMAKEISADGDNLIAITLNDQVLYAKTTSFDWSEKWGMPIRKKLLIPSESRAIAISHRGDNFSYSDIDGNKYSVSAGVTSLYLLDKKGDKIYFADPWLPAKFEHQIDTPYEGRGIMQNMSVSASTLFIINAKGEMFTRIYDFDTSGQNPVLSYSYKREKRNEASIVTRTLPAEAWRRQPYIDGEITAEITIYNTGEDNKDFELRVEGINDFGNAGYYRKKIFDEKWKFVVTHHDLVGSLLDCQSVIDNELLTDVKTKNYDGTLWRKRKKKKIEINIDGLHPYISPATVTLTIADQKFKAILHSRRTSKKRYGYKMRGTLILPDALIKSSDHNISKLVKSYFKALQYIDFSIKIYNDGRVKARQSLHIFDIEQLVDMFIFNIREPLLKLNGIDGFLKGGNLKPLLMIPIKFNTQLRN